jgi:hypothetical protein
MRGPISAVSSVPCGDSQCASPFSKARNDLVCYFADQHGNGDGHATLAGRAICRTDQRIDGLIEVRVRHHDHVVLGATERLHALAAPGAFLIDMPGHCGRADEADSLDVRVLEDRAHDGGVAVDHIEQSVGQAGTLEQLRHHHRGGRVAFARLQDECISGREREREHPARNHAREVERRDAGDYSQRLPDRPVIEPVCHLVREVALLQGRDSAGELDDLDSAHHFAPRVGESLSVLFGDRRSERIAVLVENVEELKQNASPTNGRHVCPRRLRFPSRIDSGLQILPGAKCHVADVLTRGRIEHRLRSRSAAAKETAADPVLEGGGEAGCCMRRHVGSSRGRRGSGSSAASPKALHRDSRECHCLLAHR